MKVRPYFLYRLLARDLRVIGNYVLMFLGLSAFLLVFAFSTKPMATAVTTGLFTLTIPVAAVSILQFVQLAIWKERVGGTFVVLRSLPVTNNEISLAKISTVLIATSMVFLLPVAVLYSIAVVHGIAFPLHTRWILMWVYALFLSLGVLCAGAALLYDQKRAMIVPFIVLIVVCLIGYEIGRLPNIGRTFLAWRAEEWGLLVVGVAIALLVRACLTTFNRRDLVQLIE
jgi:hypothetical protein